MTGKQLERLVTAVEQLTVHVRELIDINQCLLETTLEDQQEEAGSRFLDDTELDD